MDTLCTQVLGNVHGLVRLIHLLVLRKIGGMNGKQKLRLTLSLFIVHNMLALRWWDDGGIFLTSGLSIPSSFPVGIKKCSGA